MHRKMKNIEIEKEREFLDLEESYKKKMSEL